MTTQTPARIRLEVVAGPDSGKVILIDRQGTTVLGRSEKADERVCDPSVSRKHAEITLSGVKASVRDLGSSYGLYLGAEKIAESDLREGDRLRMGDTILLVRLEGSAAFPSIRGYQILEIVGKGSMGKVYRAHWEEGDREVALKVIQYASEPDPDQIAYFNREARTQLLVRHPNVVEVVDVGVSDGVHYIAMEFVRGRSASDLIRSEGTLAANLCLSIGVQASAALVAAEAKGIVHRDIKPGNLIVTDTGVTKVCDFGLAREFENAGLSGLTQAGAILGTLGYMPPEQLEDARSVTPKSDQYALGASLFHMATGQVRLGGGKLREQMKRIRTVDPAAPSSIVPTLPRALDFVICKMMARDPAVRFKSAAEYHKALAGIFEKM